MKALNRERIRLDEGFEHRDEEALGMAATQPVLGDLVDGVDVVHAFRPVAVALVDGIDAQESGLPVGAGLAPLAMATTRARVLVNTLRRLR